MIGNAISDVDAGSLPAIAVTGLNASNGNWQYSINNDTSWSNFGTVSDSSARLLAADTNTRIRFVPNSNYIGSSNISSIKINFMVMLVTTHLLLVGELAALL